MVSGIPSFTIPGIVVESRELKTKEGKVWAYGTKLMAMGGTFEVTTQDQDLWKRFGNGQEGIATGRFENFSGSWKFIVQDWKPSKAA